MQQLVRTIAIVGGGFSGTVLAANLLRKAAHTPTRLLLIEREHDIGCGLAYENHALHRRLLLNVTAGRMSATTAAPLEFFHFAQRRLPNVTIEDFLPRALYGEYLQEVLLAAELSAARSIRLKRVRAEVIRVKRIDRSRPLQLELSDGKTIVADQVVVASGNPPPAPLGMCTGLSDGYIDDPWQPGALDGVAGEVLLIGTSLTMADMVLTLAGRPEVTRVHALSRHGLVPPRQTAFRPDAFKGDGSSLLLVASSSLRSLSRAVRGLAEEAESAGGDWREAVTFVRNLAPRIWQRLPERDRARFLRHLRAYWDIHRHRLPPQTVTRLNELRDRGRLHILAARIEKCSRVDGRIRVPYRGRGHAPTTELFVDHAINCTGPDYDVARTRDPLWRSLVDSGLAVRDALGLGVKTGANGALFDADGWPGPHLYYLGPMLRADHWEATAAAELRVHAEQLAAALMNGDRIENTSLRRAAP
ncbi:MAG: FAD/NAD(P)-binding protein [Steroidobacteraceae bacterium]